MGISWKQLRDMRKTLGMTQQQFADEIGVHVRTIRNWEREGASVPQKEGYRVYELLFGANNDATEEAEERDGWAGWMRGALRVRQWTIDDLGQRTAGRIPPRRLVEILRGAIPDDGEIDTLAAALQVERESVARVSGALRDLSSYSDRELLLELLRRDAGESSAHLPWPSFIPAPPGTPDVPEPLLEGDRTAGLRAVPNVPTSRDTIDHVDTPDLEHLDYAASRGTRKADEAPWAE